jgi:hypothetical protein
MRNLQIANSRIATIRGVYALWQSCKPDRDKFKPCRLGVELSKVSAEWTCTGAINEKLSLPGKMIGVGYYGLAGRDLPAARLGHNAIRNVPITHTQRSVPTDRPTMLNGTEQEYSGT